MAPDSNNNLIPDKADKVIALLLTVFTVLAVLAIEGGWFPSATVWLQRAVAAVAALSSVFGWGVASRPGKGA